MEDDNKIVEVLDDGTEITIDLDTCMQVADDTMMNIFKIHEEESIDEYDPVVTCFNLFINTYHVLLSAGWTVDDLKTELDDHFVCYKNALN
jgi:hypothetical protein